MTADALRARLETAAAHQQTLLQQRVRLAELLDQVLAQLNVSQGRIAELSDLIAAEESDGPAR
jgi:hypothetical protein